MGRWKPPTATDPLEAALRDAALAEEQRAEEHAANLSLVNEIRDLKEQLGLRKNALAALQRQHHQNIKVKDDAIKDLSVDLAEADKHAGAWERLALLARMTALGLIPVKEDREFFNEKWNEALTREVHGGVARVRKPSNRTDGK